MQYEGVISAGYQRSIMRGRVSPALWSFSIMTIIPLSWDDISYAATGIFDIASAARN
jgi:hypothetical protein